MLIKACLNGSRSRNEHERIPVTPDDLANEAAGAASAGAGAVHVHPRGADGSDSLDPEICAEVISAIRLAAPGLPIGLTTGEWIVPHPERLGVVRSWKVRPDFVSVNFWEVGAVELCRVCFGLGIGVEAGLLSVEVTRRLLDSGVVDRCLRILVETDATNPEQALSEAASLEEVLEEAGIVVPQLHHGSGLATWAVLERAVDRGKDIRVGLEDTLVLPDGRRARDNAELVSAAVQLAKRRQGIP